MRWRFAVVLLVVLLLPAAGTAAPPTGFAFGRSSGNILPFRVVISNDGAVHVTGPVQVERHRLDARELIDLNRVATVNGFATLPATTLCHGALPDVATTFVRVGGKTVRVHGGCMPRYQRMWRALGTAVRLETG